MELNVGQDIPKNPRMGLRQEVFRMFDRPSLGTAYLNDKKDPVALGTQDPRICHPHHGRGIKENEVESRPNLRHNLSHLDRRKELCRILWDGPARQDRQILNADIDKRVVKNGPI